MEENFNDGSKNLSPLCIGDRVRVQNQTTVRTTKWDMTEIITAVLDNRKYMLIMDGSRHITFRNRMYLKRIPGP